MFLELISGNRALVVTHDYIWIYVIPELQATANVADINSDMLTAMHAISLCGEKYRRGGLSRPRIEPHHTLFALDTSSDILRLIIPHDHDSPPTFSSLRKFEPELPKSRIVCIGFKKGLIPLPNCVFLALCYARTFAQQGQDADPSTRRYSVPEATFVVTRLIMDEGSGRTVEPDLTGKVVVYELGLFKNTN